MTIRYQLLDGLSEEKRIRAFALMTAEHEGLGNGNAEHTIRTADQYADYISNGIKKENDSE